MGGGKMFITILGYFFVLIAALLIVSVFIKNDDGKRDSREQIVGMLIISLIIGFIGIYMAGHSSRVSSNRAASESSSKKAYSRSLSESKRESSRDSLKNKKDSANEKAFLTDFNAYLSNINYGKAVLDNGIVKVIMPDSVESMTVADFKAEAQDIYNHSQTLASGENYGIGTLYFYSQSGGELARSTFGGDIKVFNDN